MSGISWSMPVDVNISAAVQTVINDRLVAAAVQAVRQRLAMPSDSYTVALAGNMVSDQAVPVGKLVLMSDIPNGIKFNGLTVVKVAIYVEDKLYLQRNVSLQVKGFKKVVVAAAPPIAPNQSITADALQTELVDMARLSQGFFTESDKIIGLQSRRSILPGRVINDRMVQKPLVIKRGASVNIIARAGVVEISVVGQALQDGAQDQIVQVKNMTSGKIIGAKVIDESAVIVQEK